AALSFASHLLYSAQVSNLERKVLRAVEPSKVSDLSHCLRVCFDLTCVPSSELVDESSLSTSDLLRDDRRLPSRLLDELRLLSALSRLLLPSASPSMSNSSSNLLS